MENPVLLPCPFCGSHAYCGLESFSMYYSIGCIKCASDFPRRFKTRELAVEYWNTRKKTDEPLEKSN